MTHYDRRDSDALRMIDHNKRTQQRRDNAPQYDDEDAYDAAQHTAKRQQKQSQSRHDATKNGQAKTRQKSSRVANLIGKVGAWMIIGSFSLLFIGINGGFSVLGLEAVAQLFNDAGRQFWAIITAIELPVVVQVPGLPTHWPVLPWGGVIGGSLVQGAVIWMKLSKVHVPAWLWMTMIVVSLYDLGTTYFGLGTIEWVEEAGIIGDILQFILTIFITFVVEITISAMLKVK